MINHYKHNSHLITKSDTSLFEELKSAICNKNNEHFSELMDSVHNPSIFDHKDRDGNTLLHFACQEGNLAVVRSILEVQENLDIQNNLGDTALHFAVKYGRAKPPILAHMINNGASILIQNGEGNTVLHEALISRATSETVRSLINKIREKNLVAKILEVKNKLDQNIVSLYSSICSSSSEFDIGMISMLGITAHNQSGYMRSDY